MPHGSSFFTPLLSSGLSLFLLSAFAARRAAGKWPAGARVQLAKPARPAQRTPRAPVGTHPLRRVIDNVSKGWLGKEPRQEQFSECRDRLQLIKLLLLTRKMRGCYVRNLCTRQCTKWGFFF